MCGIAGLMTRGADAPDPAALEAMRIALAHRGPDGSGTHVAGNVGLTHTRLAIIDLATGAQPLRHDGLALAANGEIYNYRELRAGLPHAVFHTQTDSEPPLHLYRRDGDDYARSLRGMYAIALHDAASGRLLLSRDPFGIKPLYYADTVKGFAFASEPQALIAAGLVVPRIRRQPRLELLQQQYTSGRDTIFDGISRVLPGETLVVEHGQIVKRTRLQPLPPGPPDDLDEAVAIERLEAALIDSVEIHQRSDVPYGMFLSGGIDSSAILAIMARLSDRPVRAFTVGFAHGDVADETEAARSVAQSLGAEHVEIRFDEQDFWSLLPEVAASVDDPTADYAILPTYKLAREAGRELKVILSGEGGDELFAGYGRYRSLMRPWRRWLGRTGPRGIMQDLGVMRDAVDHWRPAALAVAADGRTPLQAAQAADCGDWLAHDLLIKLDRCLMAHGVEGRTPLLDIEVARLAFRLPDRLKVKAGLGKYLLRRWLAKAAPAARPFARKQGFTVPVRSWIAGRGRPLGELLSAQPAIVELCKPDVVQALCRSGARREGRAAWTLLFYALWHRRHMLGLKPGGDVFETLEASRG